jgi:hypothetical protein
MPQERDDSQIALRIATASAFFSVIGFLSYTIAADSLRLFEAPAFVELLVKSVVVVLSLIFVNSRVRESFTVQNYGQIPFLSTVFFYCITLLFIYVSEILFVIFHLFFASNVSLMQELKIIL